MEKSNEVLPTGEDYPPMNIVSVHSLDFFFLNGMENFDAFYNVKKQALWDLFSIQSGEKLELDDNTKSVLYTLSGGYFFPFDTIALCPYLDEIELRNTGLKEIISTLKEKNILTEIVSDDMANYRIRPDLKEGKRQPLYGLTFIPADWISVAINIFDQDGNYSKKGYDSLMQGMKDTEPNLWVMDLAERDDKIVSQDLRIGNMIGLPDQPYNGIMPYINSIAEALKKDPLKIKYHLDDLIEITSISR